MLGCENSHFYEMYLFILFLGNVGSIGSNSISSNSVQHLQGSSQGKRLFHFVIQNAQKTIS